MTIEERVARIESVLIAAGLMLPDPMPTREECEAAIARKDYEPLERRAAILLKKNDHSQWPFGSDRKRGGARK